MYRSIEAHADKTAMYIARMSPIDVEQMYGEWPLTDEEAAAILDRSLGPRPSTSLFDTVGDLGIGMDDVVLDIGARDARYALTLVERFGCRVVAVDPVARHVEEGRAAVVAGGHAGRIEVVQGQIEAIPAEDGMFDLVFCRDVLSHIPDLPTALAECRRVSRPGGHMLIYQTFATEWMESGEATRIYPDLAVAPESMDPGRLETVAAEQGFSVASVDVVGSEWREAWEEDGSRRTSQQLLHAARLLRGRDELMTELTETVYRVELANALWGVYQMIGKLEPRIYVLRKN
jgi:sarcosine/dimethylglycine N-methyltransferase